MIVWPFRLYLHKLYCHQLVFDQLVFVVAEFECSEGKWKVHVFWIEQLIVIWLLKQREIRDVVCLHR